MSGDLICKVINPGIDREGGFAETAYIHQGAYSMAERLDSLDNKSIYLIDTGFGGSAQFMIQLQKWFARTMPTVKTIRKRKPGGPFLGNAPELWKEIKERADAAVLGVAG